MTDYPSRKTASCACGALTVTVTAPPRKVHVCSCANCQRKTGSAFSYNAFFADDAVAVAGEHRAWRGASDAGRWNEVHFCPTCGVAPFGRGADRDGNETFAINLRCLDGVDPRTLEIQAFDGRSL